MFRWKNEVSSVGNSVQVYSYNYKKIFAISTGVPELADQIETVYSLMVMKEKNV
jgi:hypothetical protein